MDQEKSAATGMIAGENQAGELVRLSTLTVCSTSPPELARCEGGSVQPVSLGEQSSAEELIRWGLKKFADQPMVMTSSFGMEGCALIDMCSKVIEQLQLKPLTVAYIDTGFFFAQTHQLRKQLVQRYPNLKFVCWQTDVSVEDQARLYGGELWKNNPNMCCHIRKVLPMQAHIHHYKVWITALRRSQTEQRSTLPVLGWDWKYELLKFCPLATWTREKVWAYIQENSVPFNPLHLQNYPSISCFHCTRPVPESRPTDEVREGRWAGKDKTECGLHYSI